MNQFNRYTFGEAQSLIGNTVIWPVLLSALIGDDFCFRNLWMLNVFEDLPESQLVRVYYQSLFRFFTEQLLFKPGQLMFEGLVFLLKVFIRGYVFLQQRLRLLEQLQVTELIDRDR